MKRIFFTPCFLLLTGMAFGQESPKNLGPKVNSDAAELRPTVSPDGKRIYYLMEKDVSQSKKRGEKTAQSVCFTEKDDQGNWKAFSAAPKPFNEQRDNAVFWTSPDGQIAFIRGEYADGKPVGRGISKTVKSASGWSAPTPIIVEGYSQMSVDRYTGISMSIDGQHMLLYFSEEKNSQLNDIYYSRHLSNDRWSKPEKINEGISMEDYDEISPFIAADQKTMFFASNRPGGLGDYDIWMTKRNGDSWTSWSAPVNMGKNVNSETWEAYFSMDAEGEIGYWATTKNSLGKSDLVATKLEAWQQVRNKTDLIARMLKSDDAGLKLKGKVKLQVEGETSSETLDFDGGEFKSALSFGKKYILTTDVEGLDPVSDTIDLSTYGVGQTMRKEYILKPTKPKQLTDAEGNWIDESGRILPSNAEDSMLIEMYNNGQLADMVKKESILFDFGKTTLREESMKVLDKLGRLLRLKPEIKLDLAAHTDNIGSDQANQLLSENRAEAVRKYLLSIKAPEAQLEAHGYGESQPIAPNTTEVGRQQNRRVEIKFNKK